MALNRYVVRVDPQGKPMAVDILDTTGASVPAFESSQFAAQPRTLPFTISTPTDFWLQAPGPYDVSCKVATTEIASASGPQRVQVSDVPVLVVPPWEVLAPSSSGGSSAVSWTPTKTANYTASSGDAVPADASGGNFNVTLPAPAANARITVKNIGASGTVTVLPHASEHIDGASLYPIATRWASIDFQSNGTDWLVV